MKRTPHCMCGRVQHSQGTYPDCLRGKAQLSEWDRRAMALYLTAVGLVFLAGIGFIIFA